MILRRLLAGGPCVGLLLALSPAAAQAVTHGHARRQTGTLRVVVAGLPPGVPARVAVIGPHARRYVVTRSTRLRFLGPGSYRVEVSPIALQHAASGLPAGSVIEPRTARVTGTVAARRTTTVVAGYGEPTVTLDPATCNLDLNTALADGPIRGPLGTADGRTLTIAGPGGPLPSLDSCATTTAPGTPAEPAGPASPIEPAAAGGGVLAPLLGSPSITGLAQQAQTLTATPGTLAGAVASETAYQWQRNASGSWSDIPGATGMTYSPTSSDVGDSLRVVETATNSAGSTTAGSAPTAAVPTADEQAQALAIEAEHDADAWGAANGGSYVGLSPSGLHAMDAAITVGPPTPAGPYLATFNGGPESYWLTAVSVNGDAFSVDRSPGSPFLTYSCTSIGSPVNGCPASGVWTPPGP